MSSNFPTYDDNSFPIESFNQYTLSAFNPYSLYYYTVSIVSPLFPEAPSDVIVAPEVTFDDFKLWCGSFLDIEDIDNTLNPLATALLSIASEFIDANVIGDKNDYAQYKRIVSLYVGHYIELHLEILKDEAEKTSFTKENKEYKIELEIPNNSKEDFKRTRFGQMFWSLYGTLVKWAFQDENSTWGLF